MIILDTNVVSEPLKPQPDRHVLHWLNRQSPETLFLTTISAAELWAGVETLPAGKRRAQLQSALADNVLPLFAGRLLDFDAEAASAFGGLFAKTRSSGRAVDFADCAIAAIATSHRFMVATRNARDFAGFGIKLLNPWDSTD